MKPLLLSLLFLFYFTHIKSQGNSVAVKADSITIDSLKDLAWKVSRKDAAYSLTILKKMEGVQQAKHTNYRLDVLYYYYGIIYKNLGNFNQSEIYLNKYEAFHSKTKKVPYLLTVSIAKANLYSDEGFMGIKAW
ncbi:MAG: hypothetical protein WDN26_20790 [Chitinophagaceae bacterium]